MISLAFKRIFSALILAFFVSFACMAMVHYSKGSVVFAKVPQAMSNQLRSEIESNLNLDKPLLTQYFTWLKKALKGDFSNSLITGEKVSEILKQNLPNTLFLGGISFVLLCILSLFLAVLSVIYKNGYFDRICNFVCMSFFALPVFAFSLVLVLLFSVYLPFFPSSSAFDLGFEESLSNRLEHLVLPCLALVLSHLAVFLRFARTALIESFNQGFIEAMFARGLSKFRVHFHLVLKHAFTPIITYFAASFVSFLMSIYVVESVFSYGGIGNLVIESIIFKDYPVVLAICVLSVLAVVFINFLAEILCAIINPRKAYA